MNETKLAAKIVLDDHYCIAIHLHKVDDNIVIKASIYIPVIIIVAVIVTVGTSISITTLTNETRYQWFRPLLVLQQLITKEKEVFIPSISSTVN